MENQLFNQTLLKKYSKNFKLNPSKHDLLKEYNNKAESGEFKSETKNYLYFYDVILKGVLGYKREDVLFDEKGDVGTGRSEFVLKSDDKKFMVIELKGQGVDLDKRQSGRSDNKSPVEQAFGYAINTGDVDWIMVSNYDEFRLYNYYEKTKYISFTAKELLDKKNFSYFMLAFSRKSHIESDYITKVKEDTLIVDRKLASEFYKLYNETRLMLIKELETENQMERLNAIHYAQLILNRYMFICFAEDTNLLPAQISIDTISTPILKGNIRHRSIWQRLNELCLDINEGNEFKKISEYNGGLFSEDLDFIRIRDIVDDQSLFNDTYQNWNFTEYEKDISHLLGKAKERINPIYRNMLTISSFDFSTELDVNILGHIFENSIGDIEELKEDSKGRRKKEGIFYTPDYITDYICRNTIIPYLSISGDSNTVEDLMVEYWGSKIEELDQKIKDIKIVDPACGSGAFLNKAADVLLEIHQAIHVTRYRDKKGTLSPYFDSIGERREILLNNIYGVDLNEESTEITKLSLFLKVCRKGLKLPNLNNNIKCGNSIINDPEYTETPFNWKKQFPEIFDVGGFDIVIGNPPYIRYQTIKGIKPYLKAMYQVYTGQSDLYVYFFEKGLSILKERGYFSFITSNKYTKSRYGESLRKLILENNFEKYIDLTGKKIFEDATVDPSIIVIQKGHHHDNEIEINQQFMIPQDRLDHQSWSFEKPEILDLRDKIYDKGIKLKNIDGIQINYGIKTGADKIFVIGEDLKSEFIMKDPSSEKIIKPLLRGKDIEKWQTNHKGWYIILSLLSLEELKNYSAVYDYIQDNKEILESRSQVKRGDHPWWVISNNPSAEYIAEFNEDKIIWRELSQNPSFSIDRNNLFMVASMFFLTSRNREYDLNYILAILNSNLLFWMFKHISSSLGGKGLRYFKHFVEQLPVCPVEPEKQQPLINSANKMLQLNKKLQQEVDGFKNWLKKEFNVEKLSKKLESYYKLSEDEFIDEMGKKKVNTKSRKTREYLEREFNKSIVILKPLLQEIKQTDEEIDQMVYELYGLTDDEIKIIEGC